MAVRAKTVDMVDLVTAAMELSVAWHVAHRWVLTHRLTGERRGSRWWVTRESVERLRVEQASTPTAKRTAKAHQGA